MKHRYIVLIPVILVLLGIGCILNGITVCDNCTMLEYNSNIAISDINKGVFKEVTAVYSDESFMVDSGDVYSKCDISEYIRVPKRYGYYYNLESKLFVAPLTYVENRMILLPFVFFDLVFYIVLVVFTFAKLEIRNAKLFKIIVYVLLGMNILVSSIVIFYSVRVLYGYEEYLWVVLLGKMLLVSFIKMVVEIKEYRKSLK